MKDDNRSRMYGDSGTLCDDPLSGLWGSVGYASVKTVKNQQDQANFVVETCDH
jgi:hypothetical protein